MTPGLDPVARGLLVFLGIVLVFMLLPIAFVFVYAFSSVSYAVFPPPGFSARWFVKLLGQQDLWQAAGHSLIVAAAVVVVSLVCGTLAAVALVRYRYRGREVLRAAFLAPLVVPRIAFGVGMLVYVVVLHRFGGLDSLILAHAALTLPFAVSILSASLVRADRALEEAAMDLGATPVGAFIRVTLPQLRTGLAVSAFFSFIVSWDQVESSLFLVKPDNMTLPVAMFLYILRQYDPVIAAISAVQVALAFLVGVAFVVLARPGRLAEAFRGPIRP